MAHIWTEGGLYKAAPYKSEAELEAAITKVQRELFGPNRFYVDVMIVFSAGLAVRLLPLTDPDKARAGVRGSVPGRAAERAEDAERRCRTPQWARTPAIPKECHEYSLAFAAMDSITGRSSSERRNIAISSAASDSGSATCPPSAADRHIPMVISKPRYALPKLHGWTRPSSSSQSAIC